MLIYEVLFQAKSNGVSVSETHGLNSADLIPHHDALKAHLESMEANHPPAFVKPPHLGPLTKGINALLNTCRVNPVTTAEPEWERRVRESYDRAVAVLWNVANEFDVRGYAGALRDRLTTRWCGCGCTMDQLAQMGERSSRLDEAESGVRLGKEREWDGRGGLCLGHC